MITCFSYIKKPRSLLILILLLSAGTLLGCGNTDKQVAATKQVIKKFNQPTILSGLVNGTDKPIRSGNISVTDTKGQLLVKTVLQDSNHFQLDIPAGTDLPVILRFYPQDGSETDQLIAVAIDPSITRYDLSPLTTAIARKAEALGGYTRANLVMAAEDMVNVPDANKTSTGFRGDPTTQYGGWH